MAGFLYKGILLQQRKEPALSRDLREFFNADTIGLQLETPPVENPDELTPRQLREIARAAKIFDERDGELLADKLDRLAAHPPRWLIGDAIDDEPYISSRINPLLKNQKLAADGLHLLSRATLAHDAYFAVYKNLTDLESKIPKLIGDYPVKRIRGRYPARYQAANLFEATDTAMIGIGAILHLARAVRYHKPQTTAFVTVAGNCIGNPTNLEVSLGITIAQVLERCGLIDDPSRVIIGGSMTGISLIDTENTIITASTRAILAFREDVKALHLNCIGCSRCVQVCPEGLNPYFLYRSLRLGRYASLRTLDAQMCIGCGTCSYMCPAKLDLSQTIYEGYQQARPMIGSMRAAAVQRTRTETADFESHMTMWNCEEARRKALHQQRIARRHLRSELAGRAADERRAEQSAERDRQNAQTAFAQGTQQAEQTDQSCRARASESAATKERALTETTAQAIAQLEQAHQERCRRWITDYTELQKELDYEYAQTQKQLTTQCTGELGALDAAVARELSQLSQQLSNEQKQLATERDRTVRQLEKELLGLQKQIEREARELRKRIEHDCARDVGGLERMRRLAERELARSQKSGDSATEKTAEQSRIECCTEIEARQRLADTALAKNQTEAEQTLAKKQQEYDAQIDQCRQQADGEIARLQARFNEQRTGIEQLGERDHAAKQAAYDAQLAQEQASYDARSKKQKEQHEQQLAESEQTHQAALLRTHAENKTAIEALQQQNAETLAQVNAEADARLAADRIRLDETRAAALSEAERLRVERLAAARFRGDVAEAAHAQSVEEVRLAGLALEVLRDPTRAKTLAARFEEAFWDAVLTAPSAATHFEKPSAEPEPIEAETEMELNEPKASGWRKNNED